MEDNAEVELTDLVAICPKCYNFPQLELIYDQPGKMVINCECGYQQISDIKTYLSQMKLKNKIKKYNCTEHNNNKFQFYCNTCKVHLCALCKDSGTHNTHNLITLNTNINVYAIKQSIEKSRDHLTNYLRTLLDGYIKELLAHINKIQTGHTKCYNNNKQIIKFIEVLLNNYMTEPPNYYLISNLLKSTNFNFVQCNIVGNKLSGDNVEKLLHYFHNFSVVKENINLSTLKEIKSFNDNKQYINSLLLLKDGRLAACSREANIKIYNLQSFTCEMTLEGHSKGVSYISQLKRGKIVSCSWDKSIKVWEIKDKTYSCEFTIDNAHDDLIWKVMPISKSRIASCSGDRTIKIWRNSPPYDLMATLKGHVSDVTSILQLKGKELLISGARDDIITGTYDHCLRAWNLETYKCDRIVNGQDCNNTNCILELEGNRIIVAGENVLSIISTTHFVAVQVIKKEEGIGIFSMIEIRDGNVLCGTKEGNVAIYDVNTNNMLVKETSHKDTISTLRNVNNSMFVSGSWDSSIKLWQY